MARKDLLKSLIGGAQQTPPPAAETPRPAPATPRMTRGAIGAVGQSIADLKSRSVIEVAAEQIDNAGLEDRLDPDDAGIEALARSMTDYGQQVPVLLRHHPSQEGRYEVVYGRRRVAALRKAGLPVRAMLRDLTDRDLMIAQGQENAVRKDLSFIEKANFARQMRDMGFERSVICDALAVDKTIISRMLTVADSIQLEVLHAIGSAPSVGRDRWLEMVERVKDRPLAQVLEQIAGADSDTRFETLFKALAAKKPKASAAPAPAPQALLGVGDQILGEVKRKGAVTTFSFDAKRTQGFEDWLMANLTELHSRYLAASEPSSHEKQ